ncbi:MBL fold metallo-hydrolase [Solihabitans fulvus]|uniref:MBL fold metallo-hydrolase n=1 Tax=Solihabitans fulvus TaxID=1892852 RepID=A0A5B2XMH5_9PSEU|nr:MBL fold metallo-hydrolase [Solihabitans fulvus]KAA2264586.1 MBL fold metallo-hydrolase [Solihabitans fulvus]
MSDKDSARPDAASLREVAAGVHAWIQPDGSWWVNNAGAVLGEDGVVLVDTCATARRTTRFLAAVAAASGDAPIRLAVNTHLHGDHTYGNALLPESTVLVAHERTRAGLLADFILAATPPIWSPLPDWGVTAVRPPTVTLRDELTLHTGQRRIELRHPGHPAHTEGDVVAWLPAERVLFSGDLLFHGVTPLLLMGSVAGAIASLDWLARFAPATVVPGHGPLIDGDALPAVLDAHRRYYGLVRATALAGLAAGRTPLEAALDCELGEFAGLPDRERIVLNLHRAYAEERGEEPDLLAAFADAVALNGGPMRCVA